MKDELTFGGWLKRRRGGLGFTQKELAQLIGYAEITLRKVESDELRPSREMAEKLADVLQISLEEREQFIRFARDEAVWDEVSLSAHVISVASSLPSDSVSRHRKPLERPPRPEHFQGRKAELDKLLTSLKPGQVVTLCGPGGIGKSALAAEAVWQLAPDEHPPIHFPDGVLFHSFYNQSHVALTMEHIARSFGEEPKPTAKEAAQRVLAGRRILLVLDGAEEADDLRQVLDIRDQCGVLVTTRQRKDAIADRQDIAPLPQQDAIPLIQAWGGERAFNKDAVGHISELVGRLPLALRLVGRYLTENEENATDYLAWLAKTPLVALNQGQRREESVSVLLGRSLAQVSEQARQVMGVIGLLALASFKWEPIAAALELPAIDVRRAFGELVNYGLLLRPVETYEVSHALIHSYVREQLSPPIEVIERLTAYYKVLIKEHQADFARLNGIRPHIMAILQIGDERAAWTTIKDFVGSIYEYLNLQGHWFDCITALQTGLIAARELHDYRAEGIWLGYLGDTHRSLGQVEKAIDHHKRALSILKRIADRRSEGDQICNLGIDYTELGQYKESVEYFQQALVIAREFNDRRFEGMNLGGLGWAQDRLGQYGQAIEYYQQALIIARGGSDTQREGIHLGNLGIAYSNIGQYRQAIACFEQALAIARKIGDRRREGGQLGNLGLEYSTLGEYIQSIEYHQQALAISQEIGDRRNHGNNLGNLGITYYYLGQYTQAIACFQQALIISREIGNRRSEADHLGNLGETYASLGQYMQATEYYQQAIAISQEIGDRRNEGEHLGKLGTVYRNLGLVKKSITYHEHALEIAKEIGNPSGEGAELDNLGSASRSLGQYQTAIEYYERALSVVCEIELRLGAACVLKNLGSTYQELGNVEQARLYWERSLNIFEEIKSPSAETVRQWLASLSTENP